MYSTVQTQKLLQRVLKQRDFEGLIVFLSEICRSKSEETHLQIRYYTL